MLLVKWAIGGAVLGAIAAIMTGTSIGSGIVFGGIVGVILRKWIARKLWM
ncbi:hypothetical protein HBE96_21370 [Clostridium sp. P21]|uniref:Uncharacterized protein n=1 Tax=Clostridium muellerianum TaxID=2716538 RepID=A0A7Y0EKG7_9CLOT|nr:hypothetical protein [Clostridium muellerianum]NMM65138.1 hypothetical protein [Clostridium muellerianum]